jgi:hypothetical protein
MTILFYFLSSFLPKLLSILLWNVDLLKYQLLPVKPKHVHIIIHNELDEFEIISPAVGREITTQRALEQAQHGLARAEETLSKPQLEYMNRMRRRYHEEQIWQDQ